MTGPTEDLDLELGELLVRRGLITSEQLERAIMEKCRTSRKLADVLITRSWITSTELAQALAADFGLDFVDVQMEEIDPELMRILPVCLMRRIRSVAIKRLSGETILFAIADPFDLSAIDEIKLASSPMYRVELCIADARALDRAIARFDREDRLERIARRGAEARERRLAREEIEHALANGIQTPITRFVNSIIQRAAEDRATEVHFERDISGVCFVVSYQVDGELREVLRIPWSLFLEVKVCLSWFAEHEEAWDNEVKDRCSSMQVVSQRESWVVRYVVKPGIARSRVFLDRPSRPTASQAPDEPLATRATELPSIAQGGEPPPADEKPHSSLPSFLRIVLYPLGIAAFMAGLTAFWIVPPIVWGVLVLGHSLHDVGGYLGYALAGQDQPSGTFMPFHGASYAGLFVFDVLFWAVLIAILGLPFWITKKRAEQKRMQRIRRDVRGG